MFPFPCLSPPIFFDRPRWSRPPDRLLRMSSCSFSLLAASPSYLLGFRSCTFLPLVSPSASPFPPVLSPLFPSILYVAVLLLLPFEICACCPSRQAAIPILCDLVGFVIPFPLSGCETMKVQVPLPVCLNPRRQFSSNLRFCYVAAFSFSVYLKPLVVARVTRVSS